MKKRFTEEQIIGFLQQAEAGIPIKELCRQHGFSDGSFYNWRAKFGGMSVPDAKRLKDAKELSEDDLKAVERGIDDDMKTYQSQIDEHFRAKEKEIMTI